MADVVTPEVRSRMMSGIRSKNTKPELILRRGLHALGFRFRLHDRKLPGKPDMVFLRYKAVIFTHGCFWHGHDCNLFKWPSTRPEFWQSKITRNQEKDREVRKALQSDNWRQCLVWECALKGRGRLPLELVFNNCANWLESMELHLEIKGQRL